jgi:hypothetical protein
MLWADRLDLTETRAMVSRGSPRPATRRLDQRRDRERPPAERGKVAIGAGSAPISGGWKLTLSASHNLRACRVWHLLARGGAPGHSEVGRREPERDAGHHDAGLEQQPSPQSQSALVVQRVFPPVAHDILRDKTDTTSRELSRCRLAMCLITGRVTSCEGMSCHRLERVGFSPPAPRQRTRST